MKKSETRFSAINQNLCELKAVKKRTDDLAIPPLIKRVGYQIPSAKITKNYLNAYVGEYVGEYVG